MAYDPRNRETQIDLAVPVFQSEHGKSSNASKTGSEEPDGQTVPKRLKKRKYGTELTPATSEQQEQMPDVGTSISAAPLESYMSPWKFYDRLYTLQYGDSDYFIVAEMRTPTPAESPVVAVKTFVDSSREMCFNNIRKIQHAQFVSARRFFTFRGNAFAAFEFMPLSLSEIAGNPLLNDIRLASILGQVVDGLVYLERLQLEHTQLKCCNILVDPTGNVKIWAQEHVKDRSGRREHIRALGLITIELIQGYAKEDGNLGIDRPDNCPMGVGFLSATESATTAEELTKDSLLCLPWNKRRVAGLVSLANIWAARGFEFGGIGRPV